MKRNVVFVGCAAARAHPGARRQPGAGGPGHLMQPSFYVRGACCAAPIADHAAPVKNIDGNDTLERQKLWNRACKPWNEC
jgi:hypothetical protein